jgi:hypothetical protein
MSRFLNNKIVYNNSSMYIYLIKTMSSSKISNLKWKNINHILILY